MKNGQIMSKFKQMALKITMVTPDLPFSIQVLMKLLNTGYHPLTLYTQLKLLQFKNA